MNCINERDGYCGLLDSKVGNICNQCSFKKEKDGTDPLSQAVRQLEEMRFDNDELNRVILQQRARIAELEKEAYDNQFKARLFDALVKGLV